MPVSSKWIYYLLYLLLYHCSPRGMSWAWAHSSVHGGKDELRSLSNRARCVCHLYLLIHHHAMNSLISILAALQSGFCSFRMQSQLQAAEESAWRRASKSLSFFRGNPRQYFKKMNSEDHKNQKIIIEILDKTLKL